MVYSLLYTMYYKGTYFVRHSMGRFIVLALGISTLLKTVYGYVRWLEVMNFY